MAAAAAAGRCGRDPCGALCPLLTYLGVGYADYAVLAHVLPQPALRAPGALSTLPPSTSSSCCCWPATPAPSSPTPAWFPSPTPPSTSLTCAAGPRGSPSGARRTGRCATAARHTDPLVPTTAASATAACAAWTTTAPGSTTASGS